jgi:hypothetical protein
MAPNFHHPVMLKRQVLILLVADELAAGTVINIGLQRAMNYIQEFCKEWNLKIIVEKTKVAAFKM